MAEQKFRFVITSQSVSVTLDAGKTRFYALASFAALTILLMCALLFLPGKHDGPSVWEGLSAAPVGSSGFWVPVFLVLSLPFFVLVMTKRYVTLAYPSDETFHCDQSTLTISKVPWLDLHNNHWVTCSFSLAEIDKIQYRAITRLRGYSIYGLRFVAGGKTHRVLPGLKPRDAEKILTALKSFGADVPDDPVVPSKLKENTFA